MPSFSGRVEPCTRPDVSLSFTRAEIGAGYLWLQYSIDPVPDQVRQHGPVRDAVSGIAAGDDDLAEVRAGAVTYVSARLR